MKASDLGKIFATSIISQVLAFLNAIVQPFSGTIFVFDEWEPIASKSAVAVGFVVVLVLAGLLSKSKSGIGGGTIIFSALSAGVLLIGCAAICVLLRSGYAPSRLFLFWVRDIIWMLVYILMLIMVGMTVALICLRLFSPTGTEDRSGFARKGPAPRS